MSQFVGGFSLGAWRHPTLGSAAGIPLSSSSIFLSSSRILLLHRSLWGNCLWERSAQKVPLVRIKSVTSLTHSTYRISGWKFFVSSREVSCERETKLAPDPRGTPTSQTMKIVHSRLKRNPLASPSCHTDLPLPLACCSIRSRRLMRYKDPPWVSPPVPRRIAVRPPSGPSDSSCGE